MLQRNDTGEARMFPTLDPPIEVLAGETIDYPERLDILTPVGPRGRVLPDSEPAGDGDKIDAVKEVVNPADKPADQLPGAFARTKELDQAAAERDAEAAATLKAAVEDKTDDEAAVEVATTGGVVPAETPAKSATPAKKATKAAAAKATAKK